MVYDTGPNQDWYVHVNGTVGEPESEKVHVIRQKSPRIVLEIDVHGALSQSEDQVSEVRQLIQKAVDDLQEVLDAPSGLPGFPRL